MKVLIVAATATEARDEAVRRDLSRGEVGWVSRWSAMLGWTRVEVVFVDGWDADLTVDEADRMREHARLLEEQRGA